MNDHESPRIDPEFQALIPPLRPDEREGLRESLKREGCRDAIVVWKSEGIVLDGHNRLAICQEEHIPYRTTPLVPEPADREAAKLWMLEHQAHRRNLTDSQRAVIAKKIITQRKKISMSERGKKGGRPRKDGSNKNLLANATDKFSDSSPPKQDTRATVAAELKVSEHDIRTVQASERTVTKARGKEAAQQILDDIQAGKTTIAQAKREARKLTQPDDTARQAPRRGVTIGHVRRRESAPTEDDAGAPPVPADDDDPTEDGPFDGVLMLARDAGPFINGRYKVDIHCRASRQEQFEHEGTCGPYVMVEAGWHLDGQRRIEVLAIELTISAARALIERLAMGIADAGRLHK
jgi:hypothetical protein